MDPGKWQQIERLFHAAAEQPAGQRRAWLSEAADGDEELIEEVLALVESSEQATSLEVAVEQALNQPEAAANEQRIGPYRVLEQLGRGGLSTVYLAERSDDQFRMEVAIKVVRHGLDSHDIVERLRRERQILAHLEHPNIAKLLDGGTTEDGSPYVVMERIQGRHIDEWCDAERLSIRQRLELFLPVCDAVSHAHGSLVLHRDLKPSNIMVTRDGVPKLLDFGIAKVLGDGETTPDFDDLTLTQPGRQMLTPHYASPEQYLGRPLTTASDVYSLGVVLYLLISGRRPYDLRGKDQRELEEIICRRDPPPPDAPEESAERIDQDLETIVLKALQKEPSRRYASVARLADDLRLYLEGRPISARRDSFLYRFGKFSRRHWPTLTLASLVLMSLLTAVVLTTWQSRVAQQQRLVAERERDRATRVKDFVLAMFDLANPEQAQGEKVTAGQILDFGARRLMSGLQDEPELRAELMLTVGEIYEVLNQYDQAVEQSESAVKLMLRQEVDARKLAMAKTQLASALSGRAELGRAAALASQAVRRLEAMDPVPQVELAEALATLAYVETGQQNLQLAERLCRRALEIRKVAFGEGSVEAAELIGQLGEVLYHQRRYEQAESLFQSAFEIHDRELGDEHPASLRSLNNLASAAFVRGEYEAAAALFQELAERNQRLFGQGHNSTALALYGEASAWERRWNQTGDEAFYKKAVALTEQALATAIEVFGENHPDVARNLYFLAYLRLEAGDAAQALAPAERSLQIRLELLGTDDPYTDRSRRLLASVQQAI